MIRRFFDLSFQHKIPLWGAMLIVISALAVSGAQMYRAYHDLKSALITSADSLASTLAQTLVPAVLHDDVWRGFEIVRAPFRSVGTENPLRPEMAIVVNMDMDVFVSSDPGRLPMLTNLAAVGPEYTALVEAIARPRIEPVVVLEPGATEHLFVATPIVDGGARLATLVLVYSRSALHAIFVRSAWGGALFGLVILAVLLPINWYWGQRMAVPLLRLTQRMEGIQHRLPEHVEPELYDYRDELGRLFEAYNRMVESLREKALLERGIISAERLAAVGRLTAGIAHEINNPLAGMLTAIDTLKKRGDIDDKTQRTLGLVERGLLQVRNTVAALLVEARQEKRDLQRQDVEDVKTLLQPVAAKNRVRLELTVDLPGTLPVPAGPVRQVLINLLNNALQAAGEDGWVRGEVTVVGEELRMEVANSGEPIPTEQLEHLFEPFVSYRTGGHGLGLWVTYQLVHQMQGRVEVQCEARTVRFVVSLPIDDTEAEAA